MTSTCTCALLASTLVQTLIENNKQLYQLHCEYYFITISDSNVTNKPDSDLLTVRVDTQLRLKLTKLVEDWHQSLVYFL